MADLSVFYLGLLLRNPIIVGSCGLTNSFDSIKTLANNGAGAVVLKSLFEEQITINAHSQFSSNPNEPLDYIKQYSKKNEVGQYLKLIENCKKEIKIPVIASINCITKNEWVSFAKEIESAGADALELNIALLSSDVKISGEKNEAKYFEILKTLRHKIRIPLSIKISNHSSGLAHLIKQINGVEQVKGVVLFNRHYSPDFDIDNMKIISAPLFSHPDDYAETLRWVALLSNKITCDISASNGIWDGQTVVKQILAGAKTVQISSVLYKKGPGFIYEMLNGIETWMKCYKFSKIEDFRGKMSMEKISNPTAYERIQFMKYFSGIE